MPHVRPGSRLSRRPSLAFIKFSRPIKVWTLAAVVLVSAVAAIEGGRSASSIAGTARIPQSPLAPSLPASVVPPNSPGELAAKVTSASAVFALPSRIYPSMADREQLNVANQRSCIEVGAVTVRPDNCTFGDPSAKKTMWLIGDSHAGQWFYALDAYARARGYRLTVHAKASCVPQTPNASTQLYPECAGMNRYWNRQVSAARPDVVVVGAFQSVARKALPNLLQKLPALATKTRKLVIIGDTPRQSGDVAACVDRNQREYSTCVVKTSKAYYPWVGRSLADLANASSKMNYIDTRNWFCTESTCPPVVDSILVYRDQNHLSGYAAVWLTNVMAGALDAAISPRG